MAGEKSKRERLVEAAASLAYEQGFSRTTLADIAGKSGVPLGNVYYYFKTKDDIATAIIDYHLGLFETFAARVSELPSPKARLAAFVGMTVGEAADIARKGSQVGSLSSELLKADDVIADKARSLLEMPMCWMAIQFSEMGHGEDCDTLALQLLSSLQGASLLSQNARDPALLEREAARLKMWISGL